jgi:hypothetical protein
MPASNEQMMKNEHCNIEGAREMDSRERQRKPRPHEAARVPILETAATLAQVTLPFLRTDSVTPFWYHDI